MAPSRTMPNMTQVREPGADLFGAPGEGGHCAYVTILMTHLPRWTAIWMTTTVDQTIILLYHQTYK